jgi:hypothetical protein
MSTSGKNLTSETKTRISLAKKKFNQKDLIKATIDYLSQFDNDNNSDKLPTLSGLCLHLKITKNTLKNYTLSYSEFSDFIDLLLTFQEEKLIQRASSNKINVGFAQFLLKAKHNYIDNPQNLTQNNYTNISPEVLTEALKLMNNS